MSWAEEQKWEANWWGDCSNTLGEEVKQITYADRMGLVNEPADGRWPVYDLGEKSVLDIGGGPVSMLLKTTNGGRRVVVDPCEYPEWVGARYDAAGIDYFRETGEDYPSALTFGRELFDEVWIYNVLQHVRSPRVIIENALHSGRIVRLFEWINTPTAPGHPHTLTAVDLTRWLGESGGVEDVNENGCVGAAFYGSFAGTMP